MTVPVSVFENLRMGGPVSVPVLSNMDEKPDWTGLPSTILNALGYYYGFDILNNYLMGCIVYVTKNCA